MIRKTAVLLLLLLLFGHGASEARQKKLSINVFLASRTPAFNLVPMKLERGRNLETYHVSTTPELDISYVNTLHLFSAQWVDESGFFVIWRDDGIALLQTIAMTNPNQFLALVVNGRLSCVEKASIFLYKDRTRTELVFRKSEAQTILKSFLEMYKQEQTAKMAWIIVTTMVLFFFGFVGAVGAVLWYKTKIITRRKKYFESFMGEVKDKELTRKWRNPF